jgi:ribonuclease HI
MSEGTKPHVLIHADESCLGNQFQDRDSPGGAAVLLEVQRGTGWDRRDLWISEAGTTNNQMALRSAIEGLMALTRPCTIDFVSDSRYLVQGITEWLPGWKARGWKRKAGPIENLALWQALDQARARHDVRWRWIRGHAGHPRNEYANDLAVQAAKEQTVSGGLVESRFLQWLEAQRTRKGRYLGFDPDTFPSLPPKL